MKTICLHGWLGKRFGTKFTMEVASPAEAIRALCSQFKGLAQMLANDANGFTVWVDKDNVRDEMLQSPFSQKETLHIVPVVSGAKDASVGQIILGIVLVAASFYTFGVSNGFYAAAFAKGLMTFGTALIVGGISQMLFAPPAMQVSEKPENKPSYAFNGPVNTIQQGNCVPILYGELIHGSQVVSAGLYVEDIAV